MRINLIITGLTLCFSLLSFDIIGQNKYPVPPKTKELLFYIQRNHNKNTIIYDANFDKNGNLIEDKPIDVYWIRYEEQGQRMELRTVEKMFAYGVECKKNESHNNYYQVKLVAYEKRKLWLKQEAPFKAVVYIMINNKLSHLNHLYIFADNSGIWPDVKYIELFGKDIATGNNNYERINNE